MSQDAEELRQFVRKYNHNLRNPVATVLGTLDLFRLGTYGELPPKQERAINRMYRSTRRLLALIEDASMFVRLQQDDFAPDAGLVVVGVRLDELLDALSNTLATDEITVSRDLPAELTVHSYPDIFVTGVSHLLNNAAAHVPPGGEISVVARADADALRVTVANPFAYDIEPDALAQMTAPFWVGHQPYKRTMAASGYGLGLAVTSRLAEAAGGGLALSADERVFRAVLTLPLVEPAD